jgi:uncharacterized tellurite resistance protein B-like protein
MAAPVFAVAQAPPMHKPTDLFRSELQIASAPAVATAVEEHPRMPHLRATAAFALAVARADGRVAAAERDAIRSYLQQAYGHELELNRWILPLLEKTEAEAPDLDDSLPLMRGLFSAPELQSLYRMAEQIADSAGKRNAKEIACLKRIADAWGIGQVVPPTAPPPIPAPAKPPAALGCDEALSALEIAAGTPLSADLVRRQYRLLTERLDPARFASHGADFVAIAAGKREKVAQAAKLLIEQLGEKLEEEKKPEPPKDPRFNPDLDAVFGM